MRNPRKGYSGEETHWLFNHGTRVALDMRNPGKGYLGEGDSHAIQPQHQSCFRFVYSRQGVFGGGRLTGYSTTVPELL